MPLYREQQLIRNLAILLLLLRVAAAAATRSSSSNTIHLPTVAALLLLRLPCCMTQRVASAEPQLQQVLLHLLLPLQPLQ